MKVATKGRTLIVSDVHEQLPKLLHIEATYFPEAERVVMLGDFFDTHSSAKHPDKVAKWVKEHLPDPKLTFLWGNHDASYAFGGQWRCSGWTEKSSGIINSILMAEDWRKFRVYAEVGPFLVSHAGFHPNTIHLADRDVEALAIEAALSGQWSPMWNVGYSRGGRAAVGGPTWLDWNMEFESMEYSQIVGHTYLHKEVRTKGWDDGDLGGRSTSYCIDTGCNHIMWVDGLGGVEIVEVKP